MTKTPVVVVLLAALALCPPARAQDISGPVEFVRNVPTDALSAIGAAKIGDLLYLTGTRALSIYDVSAPEDPQLVSHVPYGYEFQNEDVSTNGRVLLISESTPGTFLHVWDVSDPAFPIQTGLVPLAGDHTHECIQDCAYSYGSEGSLVDLRDPANPQLVGNWLELVGKPGVATHDVEEVRPGLAAVATIDAPFFLLDVSDPLAPRVVAEGDHPAPDEWLFHSARWPNAATDPFLLLEAEGGDGPFMTWRVGGTPEAPTFGLVDSYTVGSTSHWFHEHPRFRGGGLVAVGWYGEGTRFLEVAPDGRITELGYFKGPTGDMPLFSTTWAVHWIADRIVYAIDQDRGIDILRFTGAIPEPPPVPAPPGAPPEAGSDAAPAVRSAARRAAVALRRARRRISVRFEAPSAGRVSLRVTARLPGRRILVADARRRFDGPAAALLTARFTAEGRRAVRRRRALTVVVAFHPDGGTPVTAERSVRPRARR